MVFQKFVVPALACLALCTRGCKHKNAETADLPALPQVYGPVTLLAVTDPATNLSQFQYGGVDIPPVLHVSPGAKLIIDYGNHLSKVPREPCIVAPCVNATNLHFHGLHVSPNAPQDDQTSMNALPGQALRYTVQVPPQQPPGLYWYHTHPDRETYRQVLDGMSGAIVVDGIERYMPALSGMEERILLLRDKVLDESGPTRDRLLATVAAERYDCGSSSGKTERVFTVDGAVRPAIAIARGEKQFWRLVNASPDLFADVAIPGNRLEVVARDGMPFAFHSPALVTRFYDHVMLPPGGRVEAVVTGTGSPQTLMTHCVDTGKAGDPNPSMVLADLQPRPAGAAPRPLHTIGGAPVHRVLAPSTLAQVEQAAPQFATVFSEDRRGFYINGKKYTMDGPPLVTVPVGSYKHWRVRNDSDEIHPFHIHQVHFLAYKQNDVSAEEPVWLDTINVPARGSVDLVMDFTDPIIRGTSLFHCHLLKHEDKGMMASVVFK